jgi:hypothetical protein
MSNENQQAEVVKAPVVQEVSPAETKLVQELAQQLGR